jgi:hypothetical protein
VPRPGARKLVRRYMRCWAVMRRLHLPIQDPCHENWDAMSHEGDARRFCGVCVKQVHDLSALTEPQARAVLADESAKGRVCVRYNADRDGNIKFKPETVSASSLWRTTLAAAGMTLALLTGCTDTAPDRILSDRCEYEVGPWGFTAERGQGTCPAVEPAIEVEPETEVVGQIMIEPPQTPEPELVPIKGEVAPEPVIRPKMGKIERPVPVAQPQPEHQIMGGLAPEPEIQRMGDVVTVPTVAPGEEKPCDPLDDAPRRI